MPPPESAPPADEVLTAELAALYEVGSAILTTLDTDEVLRLVCERAQELLGGEGASIAEYEPEEDTFRFSAVAGRMEPVLGDSFPARPSVAGTVLSRGEAVIENDLPAREIGAAARELPVEIRRAVAVPLRGRESIVGVLAVINGGGDGGFDAGDAHLLSAFATQAALAIENTRLYARERERVETLATLRKEREDFIHRLEALHTAEVTVASDVELDRLLETIAEEARSLTGARYGALGVLDEEKTGLSRFVTVGLSEEERERYGSLPEGKGLLGAVIDAREPIRTSAVTDDDRAHGVPEWHFRPTSFLGVPIRIGDEVFGNLYLTNKEGGGAFTGTDETIVSMLATQAAVAIDKARLFAEREELIESLRTAQRVRARLSSYVNHDIRNALHGVALWAERLEGRAERPGSDEELTEIARKIRRGTEHALRLVGEVLDLARAEEGRLQTWPRRVSIPDVLHAARDAILPEAERKGVAVVDPGVPNALEVVTDPDRVHQIVLNLLSNAVKFSEPGTRVRILAEEREEGPTGDDGLHVVGPLPEGDGGGWVAISVEDEGPGIPPEDRERLFGEFEQADPEGEGRRGSGIGLTLSRQLADLLGGTLTLRSRVGEGSTFTLWIPRGREAETRPGWIG